MLGALDAGSIARLLPLAALQRFPFDRAGSRSAQDLQFHKAKIYAKQACEHLSGFNVANRYLIVLYHQSGKATQSVERRAAETARLQREHGVSGTQT